MDRFSGTNYATDGSGHRIFRDPNLGAGLRGSFPNALVMNGMQEEIIRTIERMGITPSDADWTQLQQSIALMAGAGNRTINTAGASSLTALQAGLVEVDATAGNISITLPAAASANSKRFHFDFIRLDSGASTVTIAPPSGTLAPGAVASVLLPAAVSGAASYAPVRLTSDGAAWLVSGLVTTTPTVTSTSFRVPMPGGLWWQHVEVAIGNLPTAAVAVTWPTAFSTFCFRPNVGWVDPAGGGSCSIGCSSYSLSGATIFAQEFSAVSQNLTGVVDVMGY